MRPKIRDEDKAYKVSLELLRVWREKEQTLQGLGEILSFFFQRFSPQLALDP